MYPIAYETKNGVIKILFQCTKCGKKHRNKRADDDHMSDVDKMIEQYRIKFAMQSGFPYT